ncbi:Non-hemolytic phospholipase C precursor [compost metagenome]
MAYRDDGPWAATVEPGQTGELSWAVSDSGQWYDFAVACEGYAAFQRRFAGRMETGKDLISDPAMGQVG